MAARPRRRRRSTPRRRARRWLRRHDRLSRPLLLGGAVIVLLFVAVFFLRTKEERPAAQQRPLTRSAAVQTARVETVQHAEPISTRRESAAPSPVSRPLVKPPAPQLPAPKPQAPQPRRVRIAADRPRPARAAIVIDDLGQQLSHLEQLAALDLPLSVAVIPGLPATASTVSEARRLGIELLLHQPMEPREESGKNPGAGVLLTSMTAEAVREQVRANLAAVPGAIGVNNHMGSRFTEDDAGLAALMAELKHQGLFWLDSRTTAFSHGLEAARAVGVPAIGRDVFLDAEVDADAIRRHVRQLVERARNRGTAVGIGHPHPETIAVLRELRPELLASGVAFVPVSTLVRAEPARPAATTLAATQTGTGGLHQGAAAKSVLIR